MKRTLTAVALLNLLLAPLAVAGVTERCTKLLASSLGDADGFDTPFFRDADAAYRDCRGAAVPPAIRAQVIAKYAIAESVRGNRQRAIDAFTEAVDVLDRVTDGDRTLLIDVLDRLALLEAGAKLRHEAIPHAERALTLRSARSGGVSGDYAIGMMKLGLVFAEMGDHWTAEQLLLSAMQLARYVCNECDALSETYSALYALYSTQGNDAEAKKYHDLAMGTPPDSKD